VKEKVKMKLRMHNSMLSPRKGDRYFTMGDLTFRYWRDYCRGNANNNLTSGSTKDFYWSFDYKANRAIIGPIKNNWILAKPKTVVMLEDEDD